MSSEVIVRRKLGDEVLDRLLSMVERGEIKAGDRLPSERDLMQRFSVGRPAVREALQAMEGMGLVRIQHGERAQLLSIEPRQLFERIDMSVRHLLMHSPENQRHLREARLLFECAMVRIAGNAGNAADLHGVEEALQRQREAAGNPPLFMQRDIEFHVAIARASHNPLFVSFSEALLGWLFAFYPRLLRVPGTEELTLREHAGIADALREGNAELAADRMRDHLNRADPAYKTASKALPKRSTASKPKPAAKKPRKR